MEHNNEKKKLTIGLVGGGSIYHWLTQEEQQMFRELVADCTRRNFRWLRYGNKNGSTTIIQLNNITFINYGWGL